MGKSPNPLYERGVGDFDSQVPITSDKRAWQVYLSTDS